MMENTTKSAISLAEKLRDELEGSENELESTEDLLGYCTRLINELEVSRNINKTNG